MTKPRQSIKLVNLNQLVAHDDNRVLEESTVSEMADSIREHGVLMPIVVTEHPTEYDRWLILDGHHRAAAARLAGLRTVPAVVRHDLDGDAAEQLVIMLVANCQRKDLAPIERAEMYGKLRDKGLSTVEIGRRTGTSQGSVSYFLSLLVLDDDSRELVRAGAVPVTEAIKAVREVRATDRKRGGRAKMGRPVVIEAAWFGKRHPLARRVAEACTHSQRPRIGDAGCGQCWEQAIRADEHVPAQEIG